MVTHTVTCIIYNERVKLVSVSNNKFNAVKGSEMSGLDRVLTFKFIDENVNDNLIFDIPNSFQYYI